MKLHILKDIFAILASVVAFFAICFDRCYVQDKSAFYRIFFITVMLTDGYFVLNPSSYDHEFGNNNETKALFGIFSISLLIFMVYLSTCIMK